MGPVAWQAIDEEAGLFEMRRALGGGWDLRATALTLPHGGLLLVSPIRGTVERTAPWLEQHGGVRFVLAPSSYHYLGAAELLERYPEAELVASRAAAGRVKKKTGHEVGPLDALHEAMPPHARLLEPPGLKTGEVWLRVVCARGVAWVVTDAFFHVTGELSGFTGLMLRVTGTAPGLRIGGTFKLLGIADRAAYKRWLEHALETDPPQVLVPAHGEIIRDRRLARRLHELAQARL